MRRGPASGMVPRPDGCADFGVDQAAAWQWLLGIRVARRAGAWAGACAGAPAPKAMSAAARQLIDLYPPLCRDCPERFVVAHLGQSLDGRIATADGSSRWVTGAEDVAHNHRMRALFDAVVVGAGTIDSDDPQLTVRLVPGTQSDPGDPGSQAAAARRPRVFTDRAAPTLVVCGADQLAKARGAWGRRR